MNNVNKLIAFGSSPIMKGQQAPKPYPEIIADSLNIAFETKAKPLISNSKIARKILSTDCQQSLVLVSWTSTTRSEFRTEHGWATTNIKNYRDSTATGFEQHWYQGPGQWEYTSVSTALREILLAQTFLIANNIPYVFLFDNNEVIRSFLYSNPDDYLKSIIDLVDWSKFVLFEGQGFIQWCESLDYTGFNGNHFNASAHQHAAEYVLSNWHLKSNIL